MCGAIASILHSSNDDIAGTCMANSDVPFTAELYPELESKRCVYFASDQKRCVINNAPYGVRFLWLG